VPSKIERRQFSMTFQSFQQMITIDSFMVLCLGKSPSC
jgi:hypothetical protein